MKARLNVSGFVWIAVMGMAILFLQACTPKINKFTPKEGAVGTQVIIEGVRFGATPADNIDQMDPGANNRPAVVQLGQGAGP